MLVRRADVAEAVRELTLCLTPGERELLDVIVRAGDEDAEKLLRLQSRETGMGEDHVRKVKR